MTTYVLEHSFMNVDRLETGKQTTTGKIIMLGNVGWDVGIRWDNERFLLVFLHCLKDRPSEPFDVPVEIRLLTKSQLLGLHAFPTHKTTFRAGKYPNLQIGCVHASSLPKHLEDGNLHVQVEITIGQNNSLKANLIDFATPSDGFDTMLSVEGVQFHVQREAVVQSKLIEQQLTMGITELAPHVEKPDMCSFQNCLEILHGRVSLNDDIVDGVVKLGFVLSSPLIMEKSEEYLVQSSRLNDVTLKRIAYANNMPKLAAHAQRLKENRMANELPADTIFID